MASESFTRSTFWNLPVTVSPRDIESGKARLNKGILTLAFTKSFMEHGTLHQLKIEEGLLDGEVVKKGEGHTSRVVEPEN